MQVVRTILWVLVTAILVAFVAMNWTKVPVNFWPLDDGNYFHFEWPVGIVALVLFALCALPLWLLARAQRWRLNRRLSALENSARSNSYTPVATTTEVAPTPLGEPIAHDPDLKL